MLLLKSVLLLKRMNRRTNHMGSRTSINEGVNITAWYFRNRRQLSTYPKRMEWGGRSYTFAEGLQYSISKAGSMTRIFDMTDGSSSYRLQCTGADESNWTLVAITEHA
jgi:hypothetical protein